MPDTEVAIQTKNPPIKFSLTKAAINKAAEKWKVVPDVTTKEGYELAKQAKRELTPMRTAIEKEIKIQKESAQEHVKSINTKGGELVDMVKAIETPIYTATKEQDEKVEAEKQQKILDEKNRIDDIQDLIADIDGLTAGLLGADVATIEKRLIDANKITITDGVYMEFIEAASLSLSDVKATLVAAAKSANALIEQQKDIDAQQEIIDIQNLLVIVKEKITEIKGTPIDAIGCSVIEMENKVLKLEAIEIDDSYGDLQEEAYTAITNTKAKLESMISHQQGIDDAATEAAEKKEQEETELADKKATQYLADRLPEDVKVRAFMDALLAVEPPEVEDPHMVAVLRDVYLALSDINTMVQENTQAQVDTDGEPLETEKVAS